MTPYSDSAVSQQVEKGQGITDPGLYNSEAEGLQSIRSLSRSKSILKMCPVWLHLMTSLLLLSSQVPAIVSYSGPSLYLASWAR